MSVIDLSERSRRDLLTTIENAPDGAKMMLLVVTENFGVSSFDFHRVRLETLEAVGLATMAAAAFDRSARE